MLKVIRADGDHDRQADGTRHRVAPADPVPEFEHIGGVDAKLADFLAVGRDGHKVLRHRRLITQGFKHPLAGAGGVGHRLVGCERFGGDYKQRFGWIEPARNLNQLGGVDV